MNHDHEGDCVTSAPKSDVSFSDFNYNSRFSFLSRKQLQFSLLSAQDVVKLAEFEVTHRDMYTSSDRLPSQNGVLDRRLVRVFH